VSGPAISSRVPVGRTMVLISIMGVYVYGGDWSGMFLAVWWFEVSSSSERVDRGVGGAKAGAYSCLAGTMSKHSTHVPPAR
jgi:hypothetical protein